MKKYISPIVYAIFLPLVFVGTVALINLMERNFGLHTIYRVGDIDTLAIISTFGVALFIAGNAITNRIENSTDRGFLHHLRQSSVYYIVALIAASILMVSYPTMQGALLYAFIGIIFLLSLEAIIINAVLLRWHGHFTNE